MPVAAGVLTPSTVAFASEIEAIAALAWPIIVGVIAFRAVPALREALTSRVWKARLGPGGAEVEVGGHVLSSQEALDAQRREVEALRAELSLVSTLVTNLSQEAHAEESAPAALEVTLAVEPESDVPDAHLVMPAPAAQGNPSSPQQVLWVDDRPETNAYETAALRDRGIEVIPVQSTSDALTILKANPEFDAVVTDLERFEDGTQKPLAGMELLTRLRETRMLAPVFVYTTPKAAERYGPDLLARGALGVTSDATELLELLGVNFGPGYARRLWREVRQLLEDGGLNPKEQAGIGVDFVLEPDSDTRIGVEVKAWLGTPDKRALMDLVTRLQAAAERNDLQKIWLVTPASLGDIAEALEQDCVEIVSFDNLREQLRGLQS